MPTDLIDLFQLQLASQASLYDLTYMTGRKKSSERVADFFLRMQGLLPITATLEIGAHEATFSRNVKKKYPEITVRAYEANPHVYAHFLLEGELRKSGVSYEHYAIGHTDGTTAFHIYDAIDGEAEPCDSRRQSVLPRVEAADSTYTTVQIPIARLDTLCAADPEDSRYALWIDAEGFTAQILSGAESVLTKTLAVYTELESSPKFAGQSCDRDIMATLLERDFVPILRDFQFRHQYNAVFIRKDHLPLVEHEWHRFLQKTLRQEVGETFGLERVPRRHVPVAPAPLPRLRFDSVRELKEAINELPLLRAPRTGIDPRRTVVACHRDDLDEAINFYRQQSSMLPDFYVLEAPQDPNHPVHDFAELKPGMDIQLYFHQSLRPGAGPYLRLVSTLQKLGIDRYRFEQYSAKRFWNKKPVRLSDTDWDTILHFVNALCDADSQYAYMAVCRSRLAAEPGYLPLAGYKQYVHPHVHAEPGDIVCEGGCHTPCISRSSTLRMYSTMRQQGSIFGFEPVPDTYEFLRKAYQEFSGIEMIQKALWSKPGVLALVGEGTSAFTHAVEHGEGNCPCTSVDAYFADKPAPTLIKLDVEGAEPFVLKGAQQTIRNHLPKLMLSIYHGRRGPDWITLPHMLLEMNVSYDYYCGHHNPWYNETIIYSRKKGL